MSDSSLLFDLPISIRQFLPHREPMLMVDDVLELDNEHITTNFKISSDNIFVENGIFREVGIIENAAQTCSGIVGWPHFEENKSKEDYSIIGYISRVKSVDIFTLPPVDAVLITKGKLLSMHEIGGIYNCDMSCNTELDGKIIAISKFGLIIRP